MKTRTIAFMFLAMLLALTLVAPPVYAQAIPVLPHAFYGAVEISGSPAPAGTEVEVRGEGVQTGADNNPIVTTIKGEYGSPNPLGSKLIVQGNISDGAVLTFYVNGVQSDQTAEWHSGEVTELDITAAIETPPPETTPLPKPASFSLGSFTISPNEVAIGGSVTISVNVANTGEQAGDYNLTLKVDGAVEATKDITVAGGSSQNVTFTTAKDLPGTYSVDINGLSGTFVVKEAPPAPEPASSTPSASEPTSPAPPVPPAAPAKSGNWPVLWGVIGGVILIGIIISLVARRKAY
jgi:hypothetical protein